MTIYDQMLKERQRLKTEIHSVQTKLKKLPAGRLICNRNGNGFKWYRSDGSRKNYSYIPKKNRKLLTLTSKIIPLTAAAPLSCFLKIPDMTNFCNPVSSLYPRNSKNGQMPLMNEIQATRNSCSTKSIIKILCVQNLRR